MAAFEKYTNNYVVYALKHNTRENPRPSKNIDIDPTRTQYNYSLHPEDRGLTAKENKQYYNHRMQEVYHYNRADVKTACQWIITAPKDLAPEQEKAFFKESYNYLNSLYGEENCIQATIHYDEGVKNSDGKIIAGQPHLHYTFIPVIENKKYMKPNKKGNITTAARYKEKVCVDNLINKKHLQQFHPNFQKWMNDKNIRCTVHSGITGGKNRTIEELKYSTRELEKARTRIIELEKENKMLNEKIINLQEKVHQYEVEKESSWGSTSIWGKEIDKSWEEEY